MPDVSPQHDRSTRRNGTLGRLAGGTARLLVRAGLDALAAWVVTALILTGAYKTLHLAGLDTRRVPIWLWYLIGVSLLIVLWVSSHALSSYIRNRGTAKTFERHTVPRPRERMGLVVDVDGTEAVRIELDEPTEPVTSPGRRQVIKIVTAQVLVISDESVDRPGRRGPSGT